MNRRGFTLIELLLAMTLTAVLATALVRILLSDSRFVSQQDSMMAARNTARAAQNVLSVELRMVSDGGLVAAAAESVTVRVPYAFGIGCDRDDTDRIASLMPADSLMYVTAEPDGLMRRRQDGTYEFSGVTSVSASTESEECTDEDVSVVPGGAVVALRPDNAVQDGQIFFLYQTITFKFSPSTDVPGRIGLWRRVNTNAYEELVAPFDTTSRFRFLVGATPQPTDIVPADLATVSGLEINLVTESYVIPQGKSDYMEFALPLQVAFLNRVG